MKERAKDWQEHTCEECKYFFQDYDNVHEYCALREDEIEDMLIFSRWESKNEL